MITMTRTTTPPTGLWMMMRNDQRPRTGAVGDVGGGLAEGGEPQRLGDVELEPQVGVVLVLDEHAQALAAGLQHRLEPLAAVRRRHRRLVLHIRQARRQPHQLVRALRPVRREVPARRRRRRHHRRRHERHRPRTHGGQSSPELMLSARRGSEASARASE